jgi:hypothetical protein
VTYTFAVGAKGTLTGNALADLDDNGSQETAGSIKGKLKGKAGELKQKLSISLVNEVAPLAKLKVSIADELSIPGNTLARLQKASGKIGDVKIKELTPTSGPLPVAAQGWRVKLHRRRGWPGAERACSRSTAAGPSCSRARNKFNFASGLSTVKLQTDPARPTRVIKLQLKRAELDDDVLPNAVWAET